MDELFRPVEGFPGYRVSLNGEVQSCWLKAGRNSRMIETWKPLKPIERDGYLTVSPTLGRGKKQPQGIHRLVLRAFVGAAPEGCICCHNDGDRMNNHLDNLRWDTHQANSDDAIRHGTKARGEALRSKLMAADVMEIRRLRAEEGHTMRSLADRFGISQSNIKAIVHRKLWKHLP
jgi:hypothetical protein